MPMTPGILRALGKIAASRKPCGECGFPLPKYPGRYPTKCPNCDHPLSACAHEQHENEDDT